MRGRTHSREFKLEVVRQVLSGEKRPAQVCREHQLAESLLLRWRHEYEQRGEAAFGPAQASEPRATAQKIAELERFCGQLALENALLKKRCAVRRRGAACDDHDGSARASDIGRAGAV